MNYVFMILAIVAMARIIFGLSRVRYRYADQITAPTRTARFIQVCSLAAADRDHRRRHR